MLLITYGTRPEYIKVKPLIDEMTKREMKFKTLFTGQHKDIAPKDADYNLTMMDYGGNRLDSVMKNCLSTPDTVYEGVTHVLVQGDTSSALGLALSATHRKLKVIHLEAGLRSYDNDNPFPEEYNRKMISVLADIHLCPTLLSMSRLTDEKVMGEVYVVGNTVLDNLTQYKDQCEYGNTVLITMHRRENHEILDKWFEKMDTLAEVYHKLDFVIPLHPNPDVQKHKHLLKHIRIIDPLSHEDMVNLLTKVRIVITDSGGLQEECSFLNKKVLVCREVTERPESIGLSSFMVSDPSELLIAFGEHINEYEIDIESPFGDGKSAHNICDILQKNGIC